MSFETIDYEYLLYLAIWLAVPIVLFLLHSRRGGLGGLLVYSYLLAFIMFHWFGALAHASPWAQFSDSTDTIVGFRYSTYALFALAVGVCVMDKLRPTRLLRESKTFPRHRQIQLAELARLGKWILLPIGVTSWLLASTPIAALPSAGAILSVGKQCVVVAICLLCWSCWHRGDRAGFARWLAVTAVLPVITVVTSGFIGYGMVMVTTVLAFVAMFFRPRWALLVGLVAMLYAGASLWVVYAVHRDDIRGSVWGGEGVARSFDKVLTMLSELKPFDLSNPEHLEAIDLRLNQNFLVGATVGNTPQYVPFRNGETIYAAFAAVIPRAIWPDKPEVGGSGHYVSQHALIEFAEGTSVGMGQVIEFYINFGTIGLVVGFFVLGALLRYMDIRLVEALVRSDWKFVLLIFLAGSGLLQAGGSLMEVMASSAAGLVGASALWSILDGARRSQTNDAKRRPHSL